MSEVARDPLAELARLLPTVLDESALHELAARLQPLLPAGEALETPVNACTPLRRPPSSLASTSRLCGARSDRASSGSLAVSAVRRAISRDAIDRWLTSTIEMTDNGPRRRPRRRQSALPEHSLRAAFRDP